MANPWRTTQLYLETLPVEHNRQATQERVETAGNSLVRNSRVPSAPLISNHRGPPAGAMAMLNVRNGQHLRSRATNSAIRSKVSGVNLKA